MAAVRVASQAKPRRFRQLFPGRSDLAPLRRHWHTDLLAGVTVAVVALPLALGFGIASGLGAFAGLITSIIAGALAAILGGSNLQVTGPTGTMAVVLVPLAATHSHAGVLLVGLMAGLMLVALAVCGAGRYARYVPVPVVEGFTAGVGVVIALQQLPPALGLPAQNEHILTGAWDSVAEFIAEPHWQPLTVSAAVTAAILLGSRLHSLIPVPLLAVIGASVTTWYLAADVSVIGALPSSIPAPDTSFFDPAEIPDLVAAAVAVCALCALESLLSATVADNMTVDQHHNPDRELLGQGLANLVTPFFGGMPSSGALARTAVNVRAGAAGRTAALSHAIVLALMMVLLAPVVAHVPLAALAGVLIATSIRMIEVGSMLALARSTRADAAVMTLTLAATVLFNLVWAVAMGIALAGLLALGRISRSMTVEREPIEETDHHDEETALLHEHIVAYRLEGPLFFAAAHRFLLQLLDVADVRVVVLRMSRVSTLDASGATVLADAIKRLEHRGIAVYLSGLEPLHSKPLAALGILEPLWQRGRLFEHTSEAIAAARDRLRADGLLEQLEAEAAREGEAERP
ncbi:SulP family inorganic anion transporter [Glycomyces buryatensis]|uniref:SulP family inorganic anion transporter n=1 Tax=Glycomyces buryatensis TaxID=2570927 RepID=A0A4V4HQZ5_9ACTN|nr:SulP family inorganic anion transporter [Glycomyces buryatensis]THV35746.1 SulP family inorganic anion transporter [Glycomyces buryatensis]